MGTRGRQVGRVAAGAVVVLAALLAIRLGALERGGPAHQGLSIGDGIPATLYLPEEADGGQLPFQRPPGERPPVVVIAHGYSADQAIMSPLARSLARAGYAAVTFDFRGHGANPQRFGGDLAADVEAVVDWAETSPLVDGARIAVLGHSMGAGAVLDLGTRDDRPVAVIPVSGGWAVHDAVVPGQVLLLVAEGDPGRIADRQAEVAAELAGRGATVVASEIAGTDHLTILWSSDAVRETVAFLDQAMGVDRPGPVPGLDDPRLRAAGLYALLVVVLVGLVGSAAGRWAALAGRSRGGPPGHAGVVAAVMEPAGPGAPVASAEAPESLAAEQHEIGGAAVPVGEPAGSGALVAWAGSLAGWRSAAGGLGLVAVSLLLTAPVMATGGIDVLPLGAGQPVVVQTLLAAGLLWGVRALAARGVLDGSAAGSRVATWLGEGPWLPLRSVAGPGVAAGLAIFLLLLPLGGVVHRLVPTPERLVLWVVVTLMALPFFAAFEALVRRGGTWSAIGWGVAGRAILLAAVVLGLGAGVLPPVIGLVLPLLAVQHLLLEVFAATCYARGRSPALIAVAESVVIAWVVVTLTPIG